MISFVIHRWQAVFVFAFMLVILGSTAYNTMPRESAPEIKQPLIFVNTVYPGVAAQDVEALVTRIIEEELENTEGIKKVTSTSKLGLSSINVEFTSDTDVETALRRVRERVDIAKAKLPQDVKEPFVRELNFSDQPILIFALTNPGGLEVIEKTAEDLEEKIKRVKGVLDVKLSGKLEKEVSIEVDPLKLKHYGLSMHAIEEAIQQENVGIPGGELKNQAMRYALSVTGEIKDPELYKDLLVGKDGAKVKLSELANVRFHYKEQSTISRINGIPAISIAITKRSGENLIRIAEEIKVLFKASEKEFPDRTGYVVSFDESEKIEEMVLDLETHMYLGIILVWLVTLFALGWRNALFIGLAIPFSMLLSFIILNAMGVTLNMVVLFSLVLALGMLVDDGIVIVENIYRHSSMGKSRVQAAIDGTREVLWPVISSTLTTLAAFFPILFMPGIMGEFMSFIPITVITVLTCSLFVAITINNTVCSRFLKVEKGAEDAEHGGRTFQKFQAWYEIQLRKLLRFPLINVIVAFTLVVSGIVAYGKFGKSPIFFPSIDPQVGFVDIELPQGTPVEVTDVVTQKLEKIAKSAPSSLKTLQATSGQGANKDGMAGNLDGSYKANVRLGFENFIDRKIKAQSTLDSLKSLVKDIPDAKIVVAKMNDGPPQGHPVSFEVTGNDYKQIGEYSNAILAILKQYPQFERVDFDYEEGTPEIRIEIDREKARLLGFNTQAVAGQIRNAMNGGVITKFRQGKDEFDVVIRYLDDYRNQIAKLSELTIAFEGKFTTLGSIATINTQAGPGVIKRKNLHRSVEIWGDFKPDIQETQKIKDEIAQKVAAIQTESGYHIGAGEGEKVQDEASQFLVQAFIAALFLILLILIVQFNSVTQPAIIMATVVLTWGGVFWGNLIFQTPFVIIMTGIGIISLAGVVVKNGILLIDYTNIKIKQGLLPLEAVIVSAKTRLRPVLLTAVCTVIGLVPLALGVALDVHQMTIHIGSESSEWWKAMALAMIYGMTFSTVLTLVVVPSLILLDFKLNRFVKTLMSGRGLFHNLRFLLVNRSMPEFSEKSEHSL